MARVVALAAARVIGTRRLGTPVLARLPAPVLQEVVSLLHTTNLGMIGVVAE